MDTKNIILEQHPWLPFTPNNSKLLMLGSFPPQSKRWSMNFFYPNLNNDMWRIFGIIFFNDKNHFLDISLKVFDREKIIDFLTKKGIALYDTATVIRRLNNNASDKFLDVVTPTNIKKLLDSIPYCNAVATTGQKATEIFCEQFSVIAPKISEHKEFSYKNRILSFYRMPSSSRAYPIKVEQKAEIYKQMFYNLNI